MRMFTADTWNFLIATYDSFSIGILREDLQPLACLRKVNEADNRMNETDDLIAAYYLWLESWLTTDISILAENKAVRDFYFKTQTYFLGGDFKYGLCFWFLTWPDLRALSCWLYPCSLFYGSWLPTQMPLSTRE